MEEEEEEVCIETSQGREKRLKMMENTKEMMDDDGEVSIYVHLVDACVASSKVASLLYKLDIDSNVLQHDTLSPNVSAALSKTSNPVRLPVMLNLPLVKSAYIFSCNERLYPSGMSFVNIGSILYFMGGDIYYIQDIMSLAMYDADVPLDLKCSFNCFPPDVYAFDCMTCKLLDSSSPHWIPPMESGKPQYPITFALDKQLFVLSSQNGPQGLTYFETYNPSTKIWEQLPLPNSHFFIDEDVVSSGFVLVGRELFVSFSSEYGTSFPLYCFNIDSRSWTHQISSSNPPYIYNDSVFVHDTVYGFHNHCMISHTIAASDDHHVFYKLNRSNYVYVTDIKGFPSYVNHCGNFARRLFHLGGLLQGTTNNSSCFGLVEVFNTRRKAFQEGEKMLPCELRFVVLEALDRNPVNSRCTAKFITACHFLPEISSSCVLSAATALRLY